MGRTGPFLPRYLVGRAALKREHTHGRRTAVIVAKYLVIPARLTGIGPPARRFDLSVIDEEPDRDLCGVRAGDLSPARGRKSYLVIRSDCLEVWVGSRFSYTLIAIFSWAELHAVEFINHDPDRIGPIDSVYQDSVGTLELSVAQRFCVYFLLHIMPQPDLHL